MSVGLPPKIPLALLRQAAAAANRPVASKAQPPATGRLTQAGMQALQNKLKKLNTEIKAAKKAVDAQKHQMMLARYTPEGYKAAQAKLQKLEHKLEHLQKEKKELLELMKRV